MERVGERNERIVSTRQELVKEIHKNVTKLLEKAKSTNSSSEREVLLKKLYSEVVEEVDPYYSKKLKLNETRFRSNSNPNQKELIPNKTDKKVKVTTKKPEVARSRKTFFFELFGDIFYRNAVHPLEKRKSISQTNLLSLIKKEDTKTKEKKNKEEKEEKKQNQPKKKEEEVLIISKEEKIVSAKLKDWETELNCNEYFPRIYAILFYKLIMKKRIINKFRINLFLNGCNQLFWSDCEPINNSKTKNKREKEEEEEGDIEKNGNGNITKEVKRFGSIYNFLRNYSTLFKLEPNMFEDIIGLIFKYFFIYSSKSLCKNVLLFLERIIEVNLSEYDGEEDDGDGKNKEITLTQLSNLFIKETLVLLDSLTNEKEKFKLIQKLKYLKQLIPYCSSKIVTKLKLHLYILTRPRTSSKIIRKISRISLDLLFPYGKWPRFFLNQFVRLFYQIDWPISFTRWIISIPSMIFVFFISFIPFLNKKIKKEKKKEEDDDLNDEEDDDLKKHEEDLEMLFLY